MEGRVVDASVVAAVAFGEPRANEAAAMLRGADLYAPPLLAYELTSVARKKAQRHPERSGDIARALELALALDIHWVAVDHVAALRLALSEGVTTYDASYLFLARSLGVPLVTFDERLGALGSQA
jgi:predicted nucleic acid-binding protein